MDAPDFIFSECLIEETYDSFTQVARYSVTHKLLNENDKSADKFTWQRM